MAKEEFAVLADRFIEENREAMIRELLGFVSHPSVSRADLGVPGAPYGPDCRAMLDYALSRGREILGVNPDGTDDPLFKAEDYEGHCGAVLYGSAEEEMGIVAHLDVVPEGNGWIYEPFHPVIKDGFVIGRGADDNKAAAVIGLYLMKFFREHRDNLPLKHTLRLFMGCAEETGMADFRWYVNEYGGKVPAFSIVADSGFPACYAQKGGYNASIKVPRDESLVDISAGTVRNAIPDRAYLTVAGIGAGAAGEILSELDLPAGARLTAEEVRPEEIRNASVPDGLPCVRITAEGKGGHAAFPDNSVNAIEIAFLAAEALNGQGGIRLDGLSFLAEAFRSPFGEGMGLDFSDEASGRLTVNAGIIRVDGDETVLDIDIRFPVSFRAGQVTDAIRAALASSAAELTDVSCSEPYYIDPMSPVVTALMDVYKEITGDAEAKPYAMGGGTYSRTVPNAITFGPGMGARGHRQDFLPEGHGGAHSPDEVLNIEDWLTGFRIYLESFWKLDAIV